MAGVMGVGSSGMCFLGLVRRAFQMVARTGYGHMLWSLGSSKEERYAHVVIEAGRRQASVEIDALKVSFDDGPNVVQEQLICR